jgi:hypothetical protein
MNERDLSAHGQSFNKISRDCHCLNDGSAESNQSLRFVVPYASYKAIIKQMSERFQLRTDVHPAL